MKNSWKIQLKIQPNVYISDQKQTIASSEAKSTVLSTQQYKILPLSAQPSKSKSIHIKQPSLSFLSLPSAKSIPLSDKYNSQGDLLERLKEYLQSRRKQYHISQNKSYLQHCINIFQKPIEKVGKVKRQPIENNFIEIQRQQQNLNAKDVLGFVQKEISLNEQECSCFNAKQEGSLTIRNLVDLNRRN